MYTGVFEALPRLKLPPNFGDKVLGIRVGSFLKRYKKVTVTHRGNIYAPLADSRVALPGVYLFTGTSTAPGFISITAMLVDQ